MDQDYKQMLESWVIGAALPLALPMVEARRRLHQRLQENHDTTVKFTISIAQDKFAESTTPGGLQKKSKWTALWPRPTCTCLIIR